LGEIASLVIAAPFGNYLRRPFATSTLGTYTREFRAGWTKRLWRIASTVRYNRRTQTWVNKLGLPNPGIGHLIDGAPDLSTSIVSIHGFTEDDWVALALSLEHSRPLAVELNLSCPNVTATSINEGVKAAQAVLQVFDQYGGEGPQIIAKLPPIRWMDYGLALYDNGIQAFHLCNTIPTPGGGLSGKPLKQFSLWAIEEFRDEFGSSVFVIGGGGVTEVSDVLDYKKAGADSVAVGSMLINPFNWRKLSEMAEAR
jgi:dihydroorotate dehydrogenase